MSEPSGQSASARSIEGETYEPNPILAYLYRRFFEHIRVDEAWVSAVQRAASVGSVVYVLRSLSFLDFLAIDHLTRRYDLPRIRFANDLGLGLLEPFGKGWWNKIVPQNRNPNEELARVIAEGGSAALFLKRPPTILDMAEGRAGPRREVSEGDDLVLALLDLQRRHNRPILLVPQVFVWTHRADKRGFNWVDALLGTRQWPGKARTTVQFLTNYRNAVLRAGEPVSVADYVDAAPSAGDRPPPDDRSAVRRITYTVLRRLERERRAVLGPARKPNDRVRDEVLRSPKLRAIIRDLAGERPEDMRVLVARANDMLEKLEAQQEPEVIAMLDLAVDAVVNHAYDGIEVDKAGLERVREAAKRGTLVLLPSHKSHVDYLILSYVFHHANLQLPLIAAGDNLSFFPVGPILRRGGGFFIRRSFAGDRLYATVVDAYIRRLIREGFALEFFLEGGRSRTGKLLTPKLGLLNMVVEAALAVQGRQVFFVPVSIGYERVVEEGAYVHELSGGEKEKEDAKGLLRSTKLLAGRYGRLNIQFGESLGLHDLVYAANGPVTHTEARPDHPDPLPLLSPAKRRAMVTRLGHQVMSEINRVTAVTSGAVVATALLNHDRPGVTHGELVAMSFRIAHALIALGARMSTSLVDATGTPRETGVLDAARLFLRAETIEVTMQDEPSKAGRRTKTVPGPNAFYMVPDEKRLSLDLPKNNIVHFFVPRALISAALVMTARAEEPAASMRPSSRPSPIGTSSPPPPAVIALSVVEERVRQLSRLFKLEFMFRADLTFEEAFAATLGEMLERSELVRAEGDAIAFGAGREGLDGEGWIRFYASLVRTFLEGYRAAARGLGLLLKSPLAQKDLVRRSMTLGQKMLAIGELTRHEALSRPLLENALLAFTDQGYVTMSEGKLKLTDSFATPAAVAAIEGRLAAYLGRRIAI